MTEAINAYLENGVVALIIGCFFYSWWENRRERKIERQMLIDTHEKEKNRLYDTIAAQAEEFKVIHARLDNFEVVNDKLDKIMEELVKESCTCGK